MWNNLRARSSSEMANCSIYLNNDTHNLIKTCRPTDLGNMERILLLVSIHEGNKHSWCVSFASRKRAFLGIPSLNLGFFFALQEATVDARYTLIGRRTLSQTPITLKKCIFRTNERTNERREGTSVRHQQQPNRVQRTPEMRQVELCVDPVSSMVSVRQRLRINSDVTSEFAMVVHKL